MITMVKMMVMVMLMLMLKTCLLRGSLEPTPHQNGEPSFTCDKHHHNHKNHHHKKHHHMMMMLNNSSGVAGWQMRGSDNLRLLAGNSHCLEFLQLIIVIIVVVIVSSSSSS